MAATIQTVERTSESPHLRVGERLRILAAHREILANLVRKELKVKYAASVLGAVWSLLNPLVYLAVFSFVARVLGADPELPGLPAVRSSPGTCSRPRWAPAPGPCSTTRTS